MLTAEASGRVFGRLPESERFSKEFKRGSEIHSSAFPVEGTRQKVLPDLTGNWR